MVICIIALLGWGPVHFIYVSVFAVSGMCVCVSGFPWAGTSAGVPALWSLKG